ncbi:MAG TPA: helix-turn-helix domain-containing protein [Thermoanaerobaculia bacterium]
MSRSAADVDDDTAAYHVLRRDVGPFRVAHNRYPARHCIPDHEHATATIYLVLTGGHVERSRSEEVDCARGSVVFSPPGTRHSDAYGTAGGEALLVELPSHVLHQVCEAGAELTAPLHVAAGPVPLLTDRLRDEMERDDALTPLVFEAIALQLLVALSRSAPPVPVRAPAWLTRVRARLDDCPAEAVSLAELARIGGVHPVHLATTFRRCVGTSVGEYVRALRIEQARRALRTTDRSIGDVALDCGSIETPMPLTNANVSGNWVSLDLGNGRYAFYAHLQPGSIRVKAGDRVRAGAILGLLGNSGTASAATSTSTPATRTPSTAAKASPTSSPASPSPAAASAHRVQRWSASTRCRGRTPSWPSPPTGVLHGRDEARYPADRQERMDAFEQLVATVLDRNGYWVRTSVKVALTPEEKREIGRPSSPRWELDVVAYCGLTNELLARGRTDPACRGELRQQRRISRRQTAAAR